MSKEPGLIPSGNLLRAANRSSKVGIQRRDRYYMELTAKVAQGSKCVRAQYGTVIVSRDDRIIGTGYNGKPRGSCNDGICYREGLTDNSRAKPNCCIHSEANSLMFTPALERLGGTMYVSGIPCDDCALLIMQSGVARLVYFDGAARSGHRGNADEDLWQRYGSKIERVPYTPEAWAAKFGGEPTQEEQNNRNG